MLLLAGYIAHAKQRRSSLASKSAVLYPQPFGTHQQSGSCPEATLIAYIMAESHKGDIFWLMPCTGRCGVIA